MPLNKISQRSAILLEHARKSGLSEEALLQAIRTEDFGVFASAHNEHFSYDELFSYAQEHGEDLEKAVLEGYQITFNTRNGLKIWLEEAFRLHAETDFSVGEGIMEGIKLSVDELARLRKALAVNWIISEEKQTDTGFVIELSLRGLQA